MIADLHCRTLSWPLRVLHFFGGFGVDQVEELLEKASVASSNCNKAVMEAIQEAKKLLEDLCELKDLEQLLRLKEIMIRVTGC